jgi:hypothetical protein
MDLFPNNQNVDLNKSIQKIHHSLKEHQVCRFSVILYYAREIDTAFLKKGINFPCVIQNDQKTDYFAGLYYPHFTTFRNETSQYY